jgi:hypothetical protein
VEIVSFGTLVGSIESFVRQTFLPVLRATKKGGVFSVVLTMVVLFGAYLLYQYTAQRPRLNSRDVLSENARGGYVIIQNGSIINHYTHTSPGSTREIISFATLNIG